MPSATTPMIGPRRRFGGSGVLPALPGRSGGTPRAPVEAALKTSLTVDEAEEILTRLAGACLGQPAAEVDVDAISDGTDVAVCGILQHIEEAGVHSGDSACSIPPYSLSDKVVAEIERQTEALALALGVKGLMNVQFAVKEDQVYLIEVNPRASRTVPFVAKAIGRPVAKIAARVMAGEPLSAFEPIDRAIGHIAVKAPVFPFARFPGTDPVLGPEMKSTGEVMGIDKDFDIAFAKALLGAGMAGTSRISGIFFSRSSARRDETKTST